MLNEIWIGECRSEGREGKSAYDSGRGQKLIERMSLEQDCFYSKIIFSEPDISDESRGTVHSRVDGTSPLLC